jgi:hypothetical protein
MIGGRATSTSCVMPQPRWPFGGVLFCGGGRPSPASLSGTLAMALLHRESTQTRNAGLESVQHPDTLRGEILGAAL